MSRLFVLAVLFAGAAQAAPAPAPWQSSGTAVLDVAALADPPEAVFDRRAMEFNDEILALGVVSDDGCGRVRIYSTESAQEIPEGPADWTLSPPDAENCALSPGSQFLRIFGARLEMSDDLLAVSDLRPVPEGSGSTIGNRVYLYRPVRQGGAIADWELVQTLAGTAVDARGFGEQVVIGGEGLLISGVVEGGDISREVLFRYAREVSGGYELVGSYIADATQPELFGPAREEFALAGDQVIRLKCGLAVLNVNPPGQGFQAAPVTDNNECYHSLEVSGDYLAAAHFDKTFINLEEPFIDIYQRVAGDQWRFIQTLDPGVGEVVLPTEGSTLSFQLNGSDLVVNAVRPARPACRYETVSIHYRLQPDGTFQPIQQIPLNGFRRCGLKKVAIDGERLAVIDAVNQPGIQVLKVGLFSRAEGTHFLINRGISGGWWFGPQRSGQGLFLEVLGPAESPRLLMHWDTHDNQGEQMWLRGVGQVDFDRVSMSVNEPVGGRFGAAFDPDTVQRNPWGQVELIFESCDRGSLRYQSDEFGNGELPLIRHSRVEGLDCGNALGSEAARRWTGSWADPTHRGEGFMLHVADTASDPVMVASWNTYEPGGDQAWLYADGRIGADAELFESPASRPTGLRFDAVPGDPGVVRQPWGVYSLERQGCARIDLAYAADNGGFGSGTQQLQRITIPLGLACSP